MSNSVKDDEYDLDRYWDLVRQGHSAEAATREVLRGQEIRKALRYMRLASASAPPPSRYQGMPAAIADAAAYLRNEWLVRWKRIHDHRRKSMRSGGIAVPAIVSVSSKHAAVASLYGLEISNAKDEMVLEECGVDRPCSGCIRWSSDMRTLEHEANTENSASRRERRIRKNERDRKAKMQ